MKKTGIFFLLKHVLFILQCVVLHKKYSMSKYTFQDRHIGPRETEKTKMLAAIDYNSVEDLIADTIPENILLESDLNLPKALTESR